jgi:hypothetical protein
VGKTITKVSIVVIATLSLCICGLLRAGTDKSILGTASKETRSFRMGFTPFPPDDTPQAAKDVTQFIKNNADIVAQHMESVPWTEALNGQDFKTNLMNSWRGRKDSMPPNATVYLAVNPGRGALADYWGASEHDPLPPEFKGKTFSDPIVMQAYLAYCKRAIEFFQPEYMAIGIEVNELVYNAPDKAGAYAELHKYIYTELKKSYPKLPIFASFTIHALLDERRPKADRERSLAFVKALMPYNDLVGVSYYPFLGNLSDHLDTVFSWLAAQFDGYGKPFAVAETGEAAEKLTVSLDGKPWEIDGSPERQAVYYQKLFAFAQGRRTAFIISFLCIDYDLLWKKIAAGTTPVFQAWQNNGFVDSKGNIRPGYQVWKKEFDLPLKR